MNDLEDEICGTRSEEKIIISVPESTCIYNVAIDDYDLGDATQTLLGFRRSLCSSLQ